MNRQPKYLSIPIAIAFLLSACTVPATATPIPLSTNSPTAIHTSSPSPECPIENPNLVTINLLPPSGFTGYEDGFLERVIDFLNEGGSFRVLESELSKTYEWGGAYGSVQMQDLTNDGISEIILRIFPSLYILKCISSHYIVVFQRDYDPKMTIMDLNQNLIPEILITDNYCADDWCMESSLYEWDGFAFRNILNAYNTSGYLCNASSDDSFTTTDWNGDGFQEIIGVDSIYSSELENITNRARISIYAWNGSKFVPVQVRYSAPIFRFQAIQDADQAVIEGDYDNAMTAYQSAISDETLDWWSADRASYSDEQITAKWQHLPTPTPVPPDTTEYPRLAAYAYYRMVALHVYLGEMDAATIQFSTLQKKFPEGNPGFPYVEMATEFWDAYQTSANMTTACTAAIKYATEHPEILIPLGSDYHGWQSRIYVPADVCPFR